jgi:hypothetical protein
VARKRKRRRRAGPLAGERTAESGATDAPRPAPAPRRRRARPDEPPPAPWGSFPLVELVVLVGIVLLVAGFIAGGERGIVMIVAGLSLASLAGLELAVREHLAGYRSHTLVLAGTAAVAVLAVLFFGAPTLLSPVLRIATAAIVFALAAWGLTVAFRRASGGLAFRIRGFRG